MKMTSESDERMMLNNGEDSPSADDANIEGNVGGNGSLKKGPWTTAEDAILVEYVTKHGEGNWNAVQKHSGLARCGKSCRLRWANHLRPDLKKGAFTPEEERRIIELHAKMGNKWARMAAELPGRTDNEIKNYWNTRIKRRQRAGLPIYPPDLCLQSLNENQQNDDMHNFSSGNVQNHSDFMSINNFDIPSVEFKNLELNHHIYTPGLLDFPASNLLDIPATSLLSQGLTSYHNKSLLPTVHPSKRLRGSETIFTGLNPSTCNAFTGGSQYPSDSPMQMNKSSVLSAYDHNSVDDHATSSCLPSGSHAVLNGNPSSEPTWAMKVELPSLQTQMGTWASPSSSLSLFDSVNILIQTPPNEHMQSCNLSSENSGLLDAVLYESETMKTCKSIGINQTPHMDINSGNVHHEIEWEAYNEQLSPLGHSSSSVFSESTPISGTSLDEPYSAGALPVREEANNFVQVQYDDTVETKKQIFSRPDFLLGSDCFGPMKHHPQDHSLLRDAIGSFLGDELSNDCKNVDTRLRLKRTEKCYDLLDPKKKEIMVLNDKDGQMHLKGLAQIEMDSMDKFHEIFYSAIQRRKVAHTGLNDVSSRSHGVLVINISTPSHDNADNVVTGKLNLIDLAGNEDNRRTCNEGIRLQESAKINQSLFALSNVIYALNNSKARIPYRESKLTRILQDSLGGTSRAFMVACLNPGEYQESVYTVSLAARSRHVSNAVPSAHKNANSNMKVDMEAKLLTWLESKGKTKSAQRIGQLCSPFHGRTPCTMKPIRKLNTCQRSETKAVSDQQCVLNSNQRSPRKAGRNLFKDGVCADLSREAGILNSVETDKEKFPTPVSLDVSKINLGLPDESEATMDRCADACGLSSPVNEKEYEVLTPINSNTGRPQSLPPDSKTPKLRPIPGDGENSIHEFGTPLDKFAARSSALKSSLIQDYIEFLNTANREELMEVKGIGEKIAEYILELRETSPIKSLGDLEKTGLSSKQVHNMFGRAAKGLLLENLVYN